MAKRNGGHLSQLLRRGLVAVLVAGGMVLTTLPAEAEWHGGGRGGGWGGGWHGGWHGGGWGWRGGWCCGIGLGYYGYPYYPYPYYPDYYAYPYAYPAAPAVAAPAPVAPAAPAASAQSWYYCDNPKGYYPYVQTCSTAWQPVPATPPTR